MRVARLRMLFRVFALWNLDLLAHSRYRRQETDARDMAARGRIYKPALRTISSSSSHTYFPGLFSKTQCASAMWCFLQKPKTGIPCLSLGLLPLSKILFGCSHVQSRDLLLLVFPTPATKKATPDICMLSETPKDRQRHMMFWKNRKDIEKSRCARLVLFSLYLRRLRDCSYYLTSFFPSVIFQNSSHIIL